MEKRQGGNLRHGEEEAKSHVWDCDSSLYDSFELRSFKRQLDSAISSRTLSMPRLLEVQRPSPNPIKRRSSKITRSVQKLIRSVFGWKPSSGQLLAVMAGWKMGCMSSHQDVWVREDCLRYRRFTRGASTPAESRQILAQLYQDQPQKGLWVMLRS
ncbi:hypothetical protein AAC387_Pa01g2582 [Persea americana]